MKYYVVWVGKNPGIYRTWKECEMQIKGFKGAKFKSFLSEQAAKEAYEQGKNTEQEINWNSICVDVGTKGNPGIVEYQGVDTKSGEVLFSYGPIAKGTNNLGEFLAIVHGLAYIKKEQSPKVIYSDSYNAMKWVEERRVSSTLVRDETTEEIWMLVDRALEWLEQHRAEKHPIYKWQTHVWGEIKADYGRKSKK